MIKKTYKEKLFDPRWQKLRLEVMQRDNFTCQYCGDREKTLNIHHLSYNINGNPWDIDDCALICLCEDCHYVQHVIEKLPKLLQEILDDLLINAMFTNNFNDPIKISIRLINNRIINNYPKQKYFSNN